MLLFTLSALSAIPATPAPASAPAAVNWPLELLKIFGPASIALIAAYLGFQFANRGRKYEILYKERYKGFEEVTGFLFNVHDIVYSSAFEFGDPERSIEDGTKPRTFVLAAEELRDKLDTESLIRPNRRHLVLLSDATREEYNRSILILDTLSVQAADIQSCKFNDSYDMEIFILRCKTLGDSAQKLANSCNKTIDLAFRDIDLPRR